MCPPLTKPIPRSDGEALTGETVRRSQSQGWLPPHFTHNLITMSVWHLARQWDDENGGKLLIPNPHHTDLKKTLISNPAPNTSDLAWEWATVGAFSVIFMREKSQEELRKIQLLKPWGLRLTTGSIYSYGCTLSDSFMSHPIYQIEPEMPIVWQIEFIIAFWSIVIFGVYF